MQYLEGMLEISSSLYGGKIIKGNMVRCKTKDDTEKANYGLLLF